MNARQKYTIAQHRNLEATQTAMNDLLVTNQQGAIFGIRRLRKKLSAEIEKQDAMERKLTIELGIPPSELCDRLFDSSTQERIEKERIRNYLKQKEVQLLALIGRQSYLTFLKELRLRTSPTRFVTLPHTELCMDRAKLCGKAAYQILRFLRIPTQQPIIYR